MATAAATDFLKWLGGGTGDANAFIAEWDATGPSDVRGPSGISNQQYRASKAAQDYNEQAAIDEAYRVRGTNEDPFRFNPRNNEDTSFFYDAEGNFGLGMKPENMYYNDALGAMVEGQIGYEGNPASELTIGGIGANPEGGMPATPGQAGQDPFTNPFPDASGGNGQPNGGLPPDYLPGPNNQGNPNAAPWNAGSTIPLGGGGTNVTPTVDWGAIDAGLTPDKTGYESSSNKDFYQQQFQNQRYQQNREGFARLAAAGYESPDPEPMDNWGWANLPEVEVGGPAGEFTWDLNENITPGETTNQQIVNLFEGQERLEPWQAKAFQVHANQNPDWAGRTNWSNLTDPMQGTQNIDSAASPEWTNNLSNVFNNMFTRSDVTGSGPKASPGYALPIGV